ncbi:hypothetical protein Goshw_004009 [Gossypium schwendimanii]|uniref:DUF7745 domain-containing protein n=2 Tax=Gossypium schwendimanii TaxID=34291 RepID=A0A7J9L8H9_GOSSC|nr:hypothetical protein [Gossypium schwendimanii]
MRFWEKYGDVAQLLFVKPDDDLLKAMVRFWDPTYRCFTFNEVDMVLTIEEYSTLFHYDFRDKLRIYWKRNIDFRDVMGKASGDRHLSLFVFAVYGLIVFTKAVGYVSVKLVDFLFQTKKGVNPAPVVLAETIISLNFIRRKGDELFLGCKQLLFVWTKSHFRWCLYEGSHQVFVPSTRPINKFLDSEWPPNQLIEEWWSFVGSLNWHMGRHQLFLIDGFELIWVPRFWKKLEEIRIKWGKTLSLQAGTFFNHSPLENYIHWYLKRSKMSMSAQFNGKRNVLDEVAELTEKIRDLEMH